MIHDPLKSVVDDSEPGRPIHRGDVEGFSVRLGTNGSGPDQQTKAVPDFRQKLPDPAHPWSKLPVTIATMSELISESVGARPLNRHRTLAELRGIAEYLTALYDEMPPRPFDLHVHHADLNSMALRHLIDTYAISTYPSAHGLWISADEASEFMATGDDFNDPASAFYVHPDDWIDRDELEVLLSGELPPLAGHLDDIALRPVVTASL